MKLVEWTFIICKRINLHSLNTYLLLYTKEEWYPLRSGFLPWGRTSYQFIGPRLRMSLLLNSAGFIELTIGE
jgi:hypothetical protein